MTYQTYSNVFEFELKKIIKAEEDRLTENLKLGMSIIDFAEYRHQVGKLLALTRVIDFCDEVNSILSKEER